MNFCTDFFAMDFDIRATTGDPWRRRANTLNNNNNWLADRSKIKKYSSLVSFGPSYFYFYHRRGASAVATVASALARASDAVACCEGVRNLHDGPNRVPFQSWPRPAMCHSPRLQRTYSVIIEWRIGISIRVRIGMKTTILYTIV